MTASKNTYDVVFHVDKTDGSLNIALTNAVNYAKALPGQTFQMVLVVNSRAVTQLADASPELAAQVEAATAQGLAIRVCNNALEATGTKPEALLPQCAVIAAGIVEVVDLQRAGYAYIKP